MKKTQSIILFSIILTLLSISTSVTAFVEKPNVIPGIYPNVISRGTPTYPFTLKDVLTDIIFSFASMEGKVVVLDFFSLSIVDTISNRSRTELIAAKAKYSATDFEIISIDIEPTDTEPEIEAYAAFYGMDWKVVMGTTDLVNYYELVFVPAFYVIDQELYIYQAVYGEEYFDELDRFVLELLPEYSVSTNPTNGGGPIPEFWVNNWYWFVLGGVMFIVVIGLVIQRRRIVLHNRKVRSQKTEARQKRLRKKER